MELHGEYAQLNFPKCPVLSVSAIAMANNNRRYKRRVTVERITCPASHPNLRDVRGELRCYR